MARLSTAISKLRLNIPNGESSAKETAVDAAVIVGGKSLKGKTVTVTAIVAVFAPSEAEIIKL